MGPKLALSRSHLCTLDHRVGMVYKLGSLGYKIPSIHMSGSMTMASQKRPPYPGLLRCVKRQLLRLNQEETKPQSRFQCVHQTEASQPVTQLAVSSCDEAP